MSGPHILIVLAGGKVKQMLTPSEDVRCREFEGSTIIINVIVQCAVMMLNDVTM